MSCTKLNGTDKKINVDDIYTCKVAVYMINEKEDHKKKSIKNVHKEMIDRVRKNQ